MKYKILKKFKDKKTKEIYAAGTEVEFSEERAKEILQVGELIERVEEQEEAPEEPKNEKAEQPQKKPRRQTKTEDK